MFRQIIKIFTPTAISHQLEPTCQPMVNYIFHSHSEIFADFLLKGTIFSRCAKFDAADLILITDLNDLMLHHSCILHTYEYFSENKYNQFE